MQLLMRRQGRRQERQMYYDAHSAFNEGDVGGSNRGLRGRNKEGLGKWVGGGDDTHP